MPIIRLLYSHVRFSIERAKRAYAFRIQFLRVAPTENDLPFRYKDQHLKVKKRILTSQL
jgi:hypothetical protein